MKNDFFLDKMKQDKNGIFGVFNKNTDQIEELKLRRTIAKRPMDNYFYDISVHHSIPVMDHEVKAFIDKLPNNSIILDVGGGWGWHWRNINRFQKKFKVVILDFVKENLHHAKNILKDKINNSVFLVHGDGTNIDFDNNLFDGYWTVQTSQHIPNLDKLYSEAHRVLKKGGIFSDYSYNNSPLTKLIYNAFNKNYIINGKIEDVFYLRRGGNENKRLLEESFKSKVVERYSEILFSPELKLAIGSTQNSFIGNIDKFLSSSSYISKLFARQHSFHTHKM